VVRTTAALDAEVALSRTRWSRLDGRGSQLDGRESVIETRWSRPRNDTELRKSVKWSKAVEMCRL